MITIAAANHQNLEFARISGLEDHVRLLQEESRRNKEELTQKIEEESKKNKEELDTED